MLVPCGSYVILPIKFVWLASKLSLKSYGTSSLKMNCYLKCNHEIKSFSHKMKSTNLYSVALSWIMRQYSVLRIYSDKLANQLSSCNCLYFHCTDMHREEWLSAKETFLLRWRREPKWAHNKNKNAQIWKR